MSKSLEERLKTHSSAFDGLLSLIPAKYYYDDATQNQWQEKKKSKEELKQNKRLKLDPSVKDVQNATASDILKEKAKTAKPVVIPGSKKIERKEEEEEEEEEEEDDDDVPEVNSSELEDSDDEDEEKHTAAKENANSTKDSDDIDLINNTGELIFDDEGNEVEREKVEAEAAKQRKLDQQAKLKSSGSAKGKKQLTPEEQKERDERLAKLREKLSSKIVALKEKRKAPGTKIAGAPSSRQQILEQRKLKLELLKKRKLQDMENDEGEKDDDEDESSEDEDEAAAAAGGDEVLFQNIVFEDGDKLTSDLSALRKLKKKKGPSNNDIKAHLAKLQLQKLKLAEMDPEKKSKFEEKSKWNRLISNIEGVKLKDDEKLLKKALKRKEKQKMKSEREWRERKETVDATILARLKRREENLQLRKENKGKRGKKQTKLKKKFSGIINKRTDGGKKKGGAAAGAGTKKRAGFEGRMKSGNKR